MLAREGLYFLKLAISTTALIHLSLNITKDGERTHAQQKPVKSLSLHSSGTGQHRLYLFILWNVNSYDII